jgi:glycine dehydrogenase subunit 1
MDFIPNTRLDEEELLKVVGASSIDELFKDIPEKIRLRRALDLPPSLDEYSLISHMEGMAKDVQKGNVIFLGAGAYDHFIPTAVDHIISRSEFYTSYTPYQPELSQGTLQAMYEYQSAICELTAMDVANASMYDGGSALAEAAKMAAEATGRKKILIPKSLHTSYRGVVDTYLAHMGYILQEIEYRDGVMDLELIEEKVDDDTACLLLQQPNFFGSLEDALTISEIVHRSGALLVACVNPISLGLLQPPGEYGADIAVGEGQPLGLHLNFGGPYLGFMACSQKLVRRLPGRIVGKTLDTAGKEGFVLTLQTREQHIRREKATSNICSNSALCALAAVVYLSLVGKEGLREVATTSLQKAHYTASSLQKIGFWLVL